MDLFTGALTNSDKSLNNNKLYKKLGWGTAQVFFVKKIWFFNIFYISLQYERK